MFSQTFLWGHLGTEFLRQIFFRTVAQIPSSRATSLIGRWKYLESSSRLRLWEKLGIVAVALSANTPPKRRRCPLVLSILLHCVAALFGRSDQYRIRKFESFTRTKKPTPMYGGFHIRFGVAGGGFFSTDGTCCLHGETRENTCTM